MTGPSAGALRLLAFCDERFRVVPRPAAAATGEPVVEPTGSPVAAVARLQGASHAVPVRLTREGGAWLLDLVATEAQARDVDARGPAR